MVSAAMNRRSFLATSAASALAPSFLSATEPDWFDRPMRWAQMTFVEDDPGNYDRSSGSTTSNASMPTRRASLRAATWPSIRQRFRFTTRVVI